MTISKRSSRPTSTMMARTIYSVIRASQFSKVMVPSCRLSQFPAFQPTIASGQETLTATRNWISFVSSLVLRRAGSFCWATATAASGKTPLSAWMWAVL